MNQHEILALLVRDEEIDLRKERSQSVSNSLMGDPVIITFNHEDFRRVPASAQSLAYQEVLAIVLREPGLHEEKPSHVPRAVSRPQQVVP